jgi:hypothetical protein
METFLVHWYNAEFGEEGLEMIERDGGGAGQLRAMMFGSATAEPNTVGYLRRRQFLLCVHGSCDGWKAASPVLASYARPHHVDKGVVCRETIHLQSGAKNSCTSQRGFSALFAIATEDATQGWGNRHTVVTISLASTRPAHSSLGRAPGGGRSQRLHPRHQLVAARRIVP